MVPWQPLFPGSVSVGVWQMACRRVIKVGEYTVKNIIGEQFITGFITKYSRRLSVSVRVVSGAVGACGRASGDGSQSFRREEIIDMW